MLLLVSCITQNTAKILKLSLSENLIFPDISRDDSEMLQIISVANDILTKAK